MSPAEALLKAADLISKPGAWTRHEMARDKDGHDVSPWDSRAVCWCALGAIDRVTRKAAAIRTETKVALMDALPREHEYSGVNFDKITQYNDVYSSGALDVAAVMRLAAEAIEN